MARRTKSSTKASEETQAQTPEESTVTTTTEAAPEAAASTTEKKADEFDLTGFNSAVEKALAEADTSTGDIPLASLEGVTNEYRKLDGPKGKNAAKKAINEAMKESMNSMDIIKARAYLQISEKALSAGPGAGAERKPADPTEAFVQRVVTLNLANQLVTDEVPEGVAEDWAQRVEDEVAKLAESAREYRTWAESDAEDKGEAPEVPAFVKNAVKLAEGKTAKAGRSTGGGGSTYSGERRDIGKHILSAFEGVDEGTFLTIAEIRKHRSDEYGDSEPSAGAISARLFPNGDASKCTLVKSGVQPGQNEAGRKGATKVAV